MKQGAFTAFRSGKLTYPRHSRLGTDKVYVCFFGAAPGPFLSHFVKRGSLNDSQWPRRVRSNLRPHGFMPIRTLLTAVRLTENIGALAAN